MLLGDLHFDRLEHHDMAWVEREKPNDVRQIQDYSRKTREVMPLLFAHLREQITELNRDPATRVGRPSRSRCGWWSRRQAPPIRAP